MKAKLKSKWFPIFKEGNITDEQRIEFQDDIDEYKLRAPRWHHYVNH